MTELTFFCEGDPAPGGSKSAFVARRRTGPLVTRPDGSPVVNVTDSGGKRNKNWRKVVAWTARSFMAGKKPFEGPIKVEFVFYFRRPGSHFRTGKFAHLLRDGAPVHHTQKPDALKCARSTEDALTGVIWIDDAQNIVGRQEKRWCAIGEKPGCAVRLIIL